MAPGLCTPPIWKAKSADAGRAIAVNAAGEAYIAGDTASLDFPITPGAAQPSLAERSRTSFSGQFTASFRRQDGRRGSPFFSRASGSSNTGNIAAALPACVRVAPDKPANAGTRTIPGIPSAMSSISLHDRGGARQRGSAGQLRRDDDIAAVLRRNEALRRRASSQPALPISAT